MCNVYEYGIVGMGPAGIGMAMSLRDMGKLKETVCFEQGGYMESINCPALMQNECCCSNPCNIISGVGGASTLSSGKISDFPAGSGLVDFFDSEQQMKELLDETIKLLTKKIGLKKIKINEETKKRAKSFYKQKKIEYKYYDVYEFDGETYRDFIHETVKELKDEGLQLFDNTKVIDVVYDMDLSSYCIKVQTPEGESLFRVSNLVIATGALDIQDELMTEMLESDNNYFEIGVRIEAPSSYFSNALSTHGDLKLKFGNGRTYCVTNEGKIIAYQTRGLHFLEGCMEPCKSTGYTNLAVLIKNGNNSSMIDFINRYREKANGTPIKQRYVDYINCRIGGVKVRSTLDLATSGDINMLFSKDINEAIKSFIKDVLVGAMGIPEDKIIIVAPELKILRNLDLKKNFELRDNLFIIGAATGKFRGIFQSLCSGLRCGDLLDRR